MDPAQPHVNLIPSLDLPDIKDADFVEVIHTAAWSPTFLEPYGDADFYPNGGMSPQPGCSGEIENGEYASL